MGPGGAPWGLCRLPGAPPHTPQTLASCSNTREGPSGGKPTSPPAHLLHCPLCHPPSLTARPQSWGLGPSWALPWAQAVCGLEGWVTHPSRWEEPVTLTASPASRWWGPGAAGAASLRDSGTPMTLEPLADDGPGPGLVQGSELGWSLCLWPRAVDAPARPAQCTPRVRKLEETVASRSLPAPCSHWVSFLFSARLPFQCGQAPQRVHQPLGHVPCGAPPGR